MNFLYKKWTWELSKEKMKRVLSVKSQMISFWFIGQFDFLSVSPSLSLFVFDCLSSFHYRSISIFSVSLFLSPSLSLYLSLSLSLSLIISLPHFLSFHSPFPAFPVAPLSPFFSPSIPHFPYFSHPLCATLSYLLLILSPSRPIRLIHTLTLAMGECSR